MATLKKYSPGESFGPGMRVTDDDDVEGHTMALPRAIPDEDVEGHGGPKRSAIPDEDVEGHWMPDAGSSMRLAKARNSDIERDARQHQLANEARQSRIDSDPKRVNQKG